MIRSFKCRETEKIWRQEHTRKFPESIQQIALRKLFMLHGAAELRDLFVPPANRLEKLLGDRQGRYSIRINDRYRICFEWKKPDAYSVEIVDYH